MTYMPINAIPCFLILKSFEQSLISIIEFWKQTIFLYLRLAYLKQNGCVLSLFTFEAANITNKPFPLTYRFVYNWQISSLMCYDQNKYEEQKLDLYKPILKLYNPSKLRLPYLMHWGISLNHLAPENKWKVPNLKSLN